MSYASTSCYIPANILRRLVFFLPSSKFVESTCICRRAGFVYRFKGAEEKSTSWALGASDKFLGGLIGPTVEGRWSFERPSF